MGLVNTMLPVKKSSVIANDIYDGLIYINLCLKWTSRTKRVSLFMQKRFKKKMLLKKQPNIY
jgi:hypothetical protein